MTARRSFVSKVRRIRQMPPQEIASRLKTASAVWFEKGLYAIGRNPAGRARISAARVADPPFFFDPTGRDALVDWLTSNRPQWLDRARHRAESVCRDPWFDEPRWTADPAGGKAWPDRFYSEIDIFSGDRGHGDVRVLWERNRHGALVDLAKAAFLTDDETYRQRCIELWDTWNRDNPYARGVNWASALEVAMRVVAWSWIYFLLGAGRKLDGPWRGTMFRRLHEHGIYLERHPSEYFSSNNHVVGEALGLLFLGCLFPALPRAAKWEAKGWAVLRREIDRQFHADGGSTEQATCYHHYSLGLFLQAALLRRARGMPIDPEFWRRLELAFQFSMHVTRPDGCVPMIGDNDDAVACPVGEGPGWDFRHYLAAGAVLFERPDMRQVAGEYSELAFWLFGPEGAQRFDRLEPRAPNGRAACFRESGYCILRSDWNEEAHYSCFDFGPLAQGLLSDGTPSSAHGHADALSVELTAFGKPMIVDPGIHSYNTDPDWVRYFRTTASHGTVVVDGASQSEFAGRLKWGRAARSRLEIWSPGVEFDYVQASHDGYERLSMPVRHRRGVIFLRSWGWILWDRLDGRGEHTIDINLPFAGGVELEPREGGLLARHGPARLQIEVAGPEMTGPHIVSGVSDPPRGWLGPAYGRREPAPLARFRATVETPRSLWQVLRPAREELPMLELSATTGKGADGLEMRSPELESVLSIATSEDRPVRLGPVETDASVLLFSAEPGRERIDVVAIQASYACWSGDEIWRVAQPVERAVFDVGRSKLDSWFTGGVAVRR